MATPCSSPQCPGQASGKCELPLGQQLCGNCCSCPGHGRRSARGGRKFGRKSVDTQVYRQRLQGAFRILQDAYDWLADHTVGELDALGLLTSTSVRRMLYSAAKERLIPSTASGSGTRGAELLETLPFQLLMRLLHVLNPYVAGCEPPPDELPSSTAAPSSGVSATAFGSHESAAEPFVTGIPSATRKRIHDDAEASAPRGPEPAPPSPVRAQRVAQAPALVLQVLLHGITDEIAQEAVLLANSFSLGPPPERNPPESLMPLPGGRFLWNSLQDVPAGPVCRVHGDHPVITLQCGKRGTLEEWEALGGHFVLHDRRLGVTMASDTLHLWLRARENLRCRLGLLTVCPPPWAETGGRGVWLNAPVLTGPIAGERITGYHGTSMHVLERAVGRGMESGWNGLQRKGVLHLGVYFHVLERAQYCRNYMMFSALDSSGFLFAPVIEISAPAQDPQGRKTSLKTSKVNQNLTYPDVCIVKGIWIYVIHVLHFWSGTADNWVMAEPRFARDMELEAAEDRDVIMQRSRRMDAEETA